MGRRLDGFDIELTFNSNGEIATVRYSDQSGCGHTKAVSGEDTVADVVQYHLDHYAKSHKMKPTKLCGFVLPHPSVPSIEYHCNLEPHIGDDHEFVTKRSQ